MNRRVFCALIGCVFALTAASAAADDLRRGYYRQPALHDDTLVFVSEGDLWQVGENGGAAVRLTTHAAAESGPVISPDGSTIAFVAGYEGPAALYTMPFAGGRPTRWTWDSSRVRTVGWTPDGRLIYATDAFSTLPDMQLVELDLETGDAVRVPLAQADDGCYDESGSTLFFTRYRFQGSHTKRYHGGTAQRLWRFGKDDAEAVPLTADHSGTSRDPMCWQGRVYFASDRDGTMNLWSMDGDGSDLRQHTKHVGWEVLGPTLSQGRIAYQLGADIHVLDIATGDDVQVPVDLISDFDQTRENWVDEPMDYLTAAHISEDGERVALTARGQVFVAPRKHGRFVEATRADGVRFREARFMPGGDTLVTLSDQSGEVELWTVPANGVGEPEQLTVKGDVLRWDAVPSPDGKHIAHDDKNYRLWVYDVESGEDRLVESSDIGGFGRFSWSPDSRWLAYVSAAENLSGVITLFRVEDGLKLTATTDRYDSYSPVFSNDGKWLYLLSDRHLRSVVRSPWGPLQPEPFFDKRTKIYALALEEGVRSPFQPDDELTAKSEDEKKKTNGEENGEKSDGDEEKGKEVEVSIDAEGLASRLFEIPVPPANSSTLWVNSKVLFWSERDAASGKRTLKALKIENMDPKVETVAEDIQGFELSGDGKKILIRVAKALHIVEAKAAKAKLDKDSKVDLSQWTLSVIPQREWRQMFVESWRLERDYFYDRGMHGVDWPGVLNRYLPLVDRVRSRGELSDLMAQMAGELAAIHTFVYGGDHRDGEDDIAVASLGARMVVDTAVGGWRVDHVYRSDPDEPERRSPLKAPTVNVEDGDVIVAINGADLSTDRRPAALLRNQVGRQVLMKVRSAADGERTGRHRHPHFRPGRERPPLSRVGVHKATARGGRRGGRYRLCPPSRDGRRQYRRVGAWLLSGLQPVRTDPRRAPQSRRQYRQLDHRETPAQGVGRMERPGRQTDRDQHAVRLPGPPDRPLRRLDRIGR